MSIYKTRALERGLFLMDAYESKRRTVKVEDFLTNEEMVDIAEACEDGQVDTQPDTKIKEEPQEYLALVQKHSGDHKSAIFEYCFKNNIPFSEEDFNLVVKGGGDEAYAKLPQSYVDTVKADIRLNNITFFDQLRLDNFEHIYSEEMVVAGLPEESRKDREQIVKIIGYDPFAKNPLEDKPQLYRDLTGMLTDSMRKDVPRAKAAVEVVTGYNNIRKYQDKVNQLINSGQLDDDTQKQLDKHLEMIAKIQASVIAISEKNGFTNSRSLGSNGKGMLSDVMNTIDEHMYDPGITNFFDIATSKSIEQISDISVKSMLNQIKLTGQEYVEMLTEQNKIVHEAQSKMRALKEALRIAKSLIVKDKLIEQLKVEYRKKGISEEDINEFINREYNMWDGR